jgi:tetratricopeptide (TPR) repeat protein
MGRGDEDEALVWIDRALAVKADHGPSLFLKGALAKKRRDLAGAEASWKQACAAMPESFQAQQELGMLLAEQKRAAEALPYLERALEIARRSEGSNPQASQALDSLRGRIERLKRGE